jgi:hypothetical protein
MVDPLSVAYLCIKSASINAIHMGLHKLFENMLFFEEGIADDLKIFNGYFAVLA